MEIETVGQLQVYLLLKKADLLEYFTKCKFKRILWFLPLPGGHFNFFYSRYVLSGHLRTHLRTADTSYPTRWASGRVRRTLEFNFNMSF